MATFTDGQTVQFNTEIIQQFEVRQSYLRDTVTPTSMVNGGTAVFLLTGSNGSVANTRGPTGEIPADANYRVQRTVTLKEAHKVIEETGFVDFVSHGSARALMQKNVMTPIYKEIDREILAALSGATFTTGSASAFTLAKALDALTQLMQRAVDVNPDDVFGVITPRAYGQMLRIKEFSSADWVDVKPFPGAKKRPRWADITWIVDPNLPGAGTNNAQCYVYHKGAVGHAVNREGIKSAVDYNSRHDLTWARATIYHGALLLQNEGVVVVPHDDTAAFA